MKRKMLLPEGGGGDRLEVNMETTVIGRKGGSKIPVRRVKTAPRTANSASSPALFAQISGFGENPVKYTDPDGREVFHGGKYPGWSEDAPQAGIPYIDDMDPASRLLGFDIHAAKIDFGNGNLRLWKGDYGKLGRPLAQGRAIPFFGGFGGEIGFYDYSGNMIKGAQLSESIGLESSTMRLFSKNDNSLIAEYGESSGWVTAFDIEQFGKKEDVYTVNTFHFDTETHASNFYNSLNIDVANTYQYNGGERARAKVDSGNHKNVIIIFGKD